MQTKVGVVGAGNIGTSRHLPAFQRRDDVTVVGVYDRNEERTKVAANEYDIWAAPDFDALCERAELVSLCTPPTTHADQTRRAMELDCHVLSEKPMAMSTDDAQSMLDAADEHDRLLSVVHNFLHMRSINEARNRLKAGELGDITRTYMIKPESDEKRAKEYLDRESMPAGDQGRDWKLYRLFWDEAAHLMYLTQEFAGDLNLAEAAVREGRHTTYGTINARFDSETGAEGNVSLILDAPISEWWFVVMGTEGICLIDIYRDLCLSFDREPDHSATRVLKVLLSGVGQALLGSFRSGFELVDSRLRQDYRIPDAGFSTQLDDLLGAVQHGEDLRVSPEIDRDAIRAMEQVMEATGLLPEDPHAAHSSSS
jgi:predicted dehydrogenase